MILAYRDLKLNIGDPTDSIGSDHYKQKAFRETAEAVRGYLASQGVKPNDVRSWGGKANPVAANRTAGGHKVNRPAEMIVSRRSHRKPDRGFRL